MSQDSAGLLARRGELMDSQALIALFKFEAIVVPPERGNGRACRSWIPGSTPVRLVCAGPSCGAVTRYCWSGMDL